MTTITNTKIELTGADMKKIKSILKGHRHNKKFDILNHVKFETSDNSITVTYHNSNDVITLSLEAYGTENAAFSFPIDALKKMATTKSASHVFMVSPDSLTIEHVNDGISQVYHVPYFDYKDMSFSGVEFNEALTIDYNTIQTISRANISTSDSEARPVLTNVVLRKNKVISTDSHRLYVNNNNDFNVDEDILIPSYIVSLIDSLTEKGDTLTICQDGYYLRLHNSNFSITTKGTGGNFPQVDFLIPDYTGNIVEILELNKFKKTLEAIKKGKVQNNLTQIEFDYNNSTMKVHNNQLNVNAEIKINTPYGHDKDLTYIAFSALYVLDAMKQIDGDKFYIEFYGRVKPFLIKSKEDHNSFALTLPVRTN